MPRFLSEHRCPRCEIRRPLCFCEFIPQINLQTRVIVMMHRDEEVLTSNTARLATKALTNSEIRVRGRKDELVSSVGIVEDGRHSLLLYPSPRSVELNADYLARLNEPVTLVVPDGNWRQAQRAVRREPALAGLPHVRLPDGLPSEYRLRAQPNEHCLCTLEAIARAIGLLESREAQSQLEVVLRVLVERTLWSRGLLSTERCITAGIPVAALTANGKRTYTPHGEN